MECSEGVGRMAVGKGWGPSATAAGERSGQAAPEGTVAWRVRRRSARRDSPERMPRIDARGPAATRARRASACARSANERCLATPARVGHADQRGFTATELLVTLVLAGVLMSLAVPGFAALTRSAGLSSAANELLAALHMARSSAVLRGLPVAVCLTADDRACVSHPDSAATGWLVFVPDGSAAVSRPAAVREVLTRFHLPGRLTISASRPTVTFWPVTRAASTSTFDLCDLGGAGRSIIVSQTGRPRVATEATSCA